MTTGAPTVLCRVEGGEGRRAALHALWRDAEALGWLRDEDRVVVQVARSGDTELARETARALVAFLEGGARRVELDEDAPTGNESLRVVGPTPPWELVVPRRWLEPHVLVTVAAVAPSATARLAGVLDAQAEALRALANPHAAGDLAYEAHRLAASDLAVACGHADGREVASPAWWAVGTNDVAVERVVAAAADIAGDELPWLRVLARHELLPEPAVVHGVLPALRGVAGPAWRSRGAAVAARVRASRAAALRDARTFRGNLYKIPAFVRRRLARGGGR